MTDIFVVKPLYEKSFVKTLVFGFAISLYAILGEHRLS